MRLSAFKVLTFDTYGTLIDWEAGIFNALAPLIARLPDPPGRDGVLERFAAAESAQQAATPGLLYSDLLATVYRTLAANWKVPIEDAEAVRFGNSVGDWPAFDDAPAALQTLRKDHTLITLTNCDRRSYAGSDDRLGYPWDAIYTAQDVGSYKPSPRNFAYLLDRVEQDFGQGRDKILHVAQSLFHDHVPATGCGLATAWIDRRKDMDGYGATRPPAGDYRIDFHFKSMAEFVDAQDRDRRDLQSASD